MVDRVADWTFTVAGMDVLCEAIDVEGDEEYCTKVSVGPSPSRSANLVAEGIAKLVTPLISGVIKHRDNVVVFYDHKSPSTDGQLHDRPQGVDFDAVCRVLSNLSVKLPDALPPHQLAVRLREVRRPASYLQRG